MSRRGRFKRALLTCAVVIATSAAPADAVAQSVGQPVLESPADNSSGADPWHPAAYVCRGMGMLAYPLLMPLSGFAYDWQAWSRDRGQCYGMLTEATMGMVAGGISVAEPNSSPVFGAGSFDRFFRDELRDESKDDNFFNGDGGSMWAPLFVSAAALLASAGVGGTDAYRDTVTRALPLLWIALAGNNLSTQIAKKGFGRKRPFLKFNNQSAIDAFGIDHDARQSFYSGHAGTAFLSASFMDRVVADVVVAAVPDYSLLDGRSWGWRLLRVGQSAAFYGLAVAVSYSRIEIDKHYMTDVLAGGFVGTLHGQALYHWAYRRPEQTSVPVISALQGGYGLIFSWSF